jgi:hypothetical protein
VRWWVAARLDRASLGLIVLGLVAVPVWGSTAMPVLRLGFGSAPFVVLLPAFVATGVVGLAQKGDLLHEALSPRPTGLLSQVLVGLLLLGVGTAWVITGLVTSELDVSLTAARNLAGYLGVGLIALRVAGGVLGNAAPLLYAVTVAVLGSARAASWSWPLHEIRSGPAAVVVVGLFVIGITTGVGRSALRLGAVRAS